MKKFNLILVALISMFTFSLGVNATTCTKVAKVGSVEYDTVNEAIEAVADNGTIELLACEITDEIKTGRINKSFTLIGANSYETILTGGLEIGTDSSSMPIQEHTVTIKGIKFKENGLSVLDVRNVNIEDNKFENINTNIVAIRVIDPSTDALESNVVIKNNTIDGAYQGVRVRTGYNVEITDNTIKNVQHNAILLEHSANWPGNKGTVLIQNNTIENWALSGEGRVFRGTFGSATELEKEITFTNNKMIREEEPTEEYAKLTNVGTTEVNLEQNYWNSEEPDFSKIVSVAGGNTTVDISEYYLTGTMENNDLNTYVEEKLPEEPAKEEETTKTEDKKTNNPDTGDNIYLYISMLTISILALGFLISNKRKSY